MTALDRYAKLEAVARYLDGPAAAAREVVVSFGERSLVIMGLNDKPIAHWPLASLRALGPPGQPPVELVPDAASDERLVLDDREMAAAIREVCPDLHAAPPAPERRGWPGRALAAGALAALLAAAGWAVWPMLPGSLLDLVPPEREAALGEALAARVAVLAEGSPPGLCVAEEGLAALRELGERLAPVAGPEAGPGGPLRVTVLDDPAADAVALPGGRVVVFRGLLEAAATPEEVAAVLAHAIGHARSRDPMRAVLDQAGAGALVSMLAGDITGERVLAGAAGALGRGYPAGTEARADAAAFGLLAGAGLPADSVAALSGRLAGAKAETGGGPARYLSRHPWSPARADAAAAADTIGNAPFRAALQDRDWIALGNICDRTRPVDPAGF